MRAYNADPAHTRKVRFYGFDSQISMGPARALLDYLGEVDPAYRGEVEPWLTRLLAMGELSGGTEDEPVARASVHITPVQRLRARLEAQRAAYVRARGEEAYVLAERHARTLEHAIVQSSLRGVSGVSRRDVFAAENVSWILEREGPEAKMVLWAHNAHLMRENGSYTPMGANLRDTFGDAFYTYRLAFNQGFEASLTRTGLPLLALDLRSAPTEGAVAEYLAQRVPMREIGAAYTPGHPYLVRLRPRYAFDGVLFVETGSATRPNPPLAP
jgi:erythromycin esterase